MSGTLVIVPCGASKIWAKQPDVGAVMARDAYIESFNGRVRDECLNLHWFQMLPQARLIVAAWQQDYNQVRPHSSLDNLSPQTFARLYQAG